MIDLESAFIKFILHRNLNWGFFSYVAPFGVGTILATSLWQKRAAIDFWSLQVS